MGLDGMALGESFGPLDLIGFHQVVFRDGFYLALDASSVVLKTRAEFAALKEKLRLGHGTRP